VGNSLRLAVSKNSRECKICLHYLATFPFHTNKSGCDTNTLIVRKEGSDWLAVRQPPIKAALAKRHLSGGTLVLYDVSSSCPLAQFGYTVTANGASGKSSMACSALLTAVRWPSKSSPAAPQIRRPNRPGDEAEGALRSRPCRPGRRPRHDHPGADQRGYQSGRARLDYCPSRPGNQGVARRRRPADVAVR